MTQGKSERLLNLTFCLLSARRYVSREQLREYIAGYSGLSDEAFERMFERDKDELRSLGVPLETGANSALFDDELGYRIPRSDFELPAIEFTAEEATVLGVAARVWETEQFAEDAAGALAKLRAAGLEPETERLAALAPSVAAREPSFEAFRAATTSRTQLRFDYRGEPRRLEPWRLACRRGNWYVVGFDLDRGQPRKFKLTRVTSEPKTVGKPGSYSVPADADLDALLAELEPERERGLAVLAIRGDAAPSLRRHARALAGPGPLEGYSRYEVPYGRVSDLAADVRVHCADVLVLEPPELRELVLAGLRAVTGAGDR